ncbi:unnamed protein product [Thlaspi arvense]|uniref:F-box domain-containing protein n=1 Tax=Thlaspi arvense TaxID=13288 RepID=A0AAU9S804_THLAR|nr:unnamed protein product [Thlaspi arvense]
MSSRTRAEKKKQSLEPQSLIPLQDEQSSEPLSVFTSLPEDVIVDILARVSTFHYPILSLVSKHFRSLVESPEIYVRRSLLGCTEHFLYALIYDIDIGVYRWYVLRRKANGNRRLVLIPSLPAVSRYGSFVAVGSRIYVFNGVNNEDSTTIDCRSHTVQLLPNIPVSMCDSMADIIERRIYIIGDSRCDDGWKKAMVVFNTETKKWEEPAMKKIGIELRDSHVLPSLCGDGW